MTLTFPCPHCGHSISCATERGGWAAECPSCTRPSVVPTTIRRATEIADRIEDILSKQDYVPGTTFARLSRIGASTRMEVLRVLFIVVAQTFQLASRRPASDDTQGSFDEFASAMGGIAFRLASSVIPDNELGTISKLGSSECRAGVKTHELPGDEKMKLMRQELEILRETQRLQSLAMSDAAWSQSETMESFVAFVKGLDSARDDYWAVVYRRIGLAFPFSEGPDDPAVQPQPKKPWWQRLFG